MDIQLPIEVQNILKKFKENQFQIFIVGGAVRDLLMNRNVADWDFTTDATPEEILRVLPEGFYDNKFGTVGIKIENGEIYEITTMRKEGIYKDSRHPIDVSWTKNIEEDLKRRDFTINAIALSQTNEVIDPFNGKDDLKSKIIRSVGNPNLRFEEDALRLMRAVRIATQLEFDVENETFLAIKKNADKISDIAWERIRDEIFKILSSNNSYQGILKLREAKILQIILPELEKCFGIKQEGPKHDRIYDIGEHSLLALKHTPSLDPLVKFASLLHDIGKPDTVKVAKDGNVTFFNHDFIGAKIVLRIGKRFNLSNKQTDRLFRLIRWHMFTVSEHQTDSAIRRFIKNVGIENLDDMFAVRVGDRIGGGTPTETSWRMEKFQERIKEVLHKPFSVADLKINGKDIMETLNIKADPKIGEILQKLFQIVLKDSSKNTKDYLIKEVKKI